MRAARHLCTHASFARPHLVARTLPLRGMLSQPPRPFLTLYHQPAPLLYSSPPPPPRGAPVLSSALSTSHPL